jgi:PAS domain S-box-containing protein
MKDEEKTKEQLISELTELRNRIIELEKDKDEQKQSEDILEESEERYKKIVTTSIDAIVIFDAGTTQVLDVNNAALNLYGYTKEEFLKLNLEDITAEKDKTVEAINKVVNGNINMISLRYHKKKDGLVFPVEISPGIFSLKDRKVIFGIIRDITERKKTEEKIRDAEKKLKIHAKELMESNVALKVLLKQREQDQKDFEKNIISNIKHLIMPYIERLKKNKSMSDELVYLNIIESNINKIVSPFSVKLSLQYLDFTPKEIMIADLVKDGKQDKDLMEILNISIGTVKTHRRNIRKKLGINNKKINLRTKLLSLNQ